MELLPDLSLSLKSTLNSKMLKRSLSGTNSWSFLSQVILGIGNPVRRQTRMAGSLMIISICGEAASMKGGTEGEVYSS